MIINYDPETETTKRCPSERPRCGDDCVWVFDASQERPAGISHGAGCRLGIFEPAEHREKLAERLVS